MKHIVCMYYCMYTRRVDAQAVFVGERGFIIYSVRYKLY